MVAGGHLLSVLGVFQKLVASKVGRWVGRADCGVGHLLLSWLLGWLVGWPISLAFDWAVGGLVGWLISWDGWVGGWVSDGFLSFWVCLLGWDGQALVVC